MSTAHWIALGAAATLLGACVPTDRGTEPEPVDRAVLHEMFTGSTCGPCLEADERLMEVLASHPDRYTLISYQIGSDPYITSEGVSRRMSYLPEDEGSYSIPWLQADGVHGLHPNLENDIGYRVSDYEGFAAEPSWLGLEVEHSLDGQTVQWAGTIDARAEFPSSDLRLYVAIVEGVTYQNIGTNGQTEFHEVMKKMIADQYGEALAPLAVGEVRDFSGSYTFQGDYAADTGLNNQVDHSSEHTVEEFTDLSVVVWVQDAETRQVHQSTESGGE